MVEEKEESVLMPAVYADLGQLARVDKLGAGRH